jgi:murein DD-endopeptidase MepM/ murein hydrolase activator NlpD
MPGSSSSSSSSSGSSSSSSSSSSSNSPSSSSSSSSNNNSTSNSKSLEVNQSNPTSGISDVNRSINVNNNIQDSFRPPSVVDGKVYPSSNPQGIDAKEYYDRLGPDGAQKSKEYDAIQDRKNIEVNNRISSNASLQDQKNSKTDFMQSLAMDKLTGKRFSRLTGNPNNPPALPQQPQQQAPSPAQQATSAIQARVTEKTKEQAMLMLARFAAWFSSFIITAVVWLIITVFMLSILAALTMFILDNACGAAQSVGNLGIPDNVKSICEYYVKLKGGCFGGKSEEQKEADLPALECIGKNFKDSSKEVSMYDLKGKTKVQKQVIREILKAGKTAGVGNETIFYTIAIHAGLSGTNNWKESTTCYGIAQLCGDLKDPESSFAIGTRALNIKTPAEYLPGDEATQESARVIQMKSIKQFIESRKLILDKSKTATYKPPDCVKSLTEGNDVIGAILYTWNNLKCDNIGADGKTSKEQFSKKIKQNYQAVDCTEFKPQLAFVDKFVYEDRPYLQFTDQIALIRKQENSKKNFITVEAKSAEIISSAMCAKVKEYKGFMDDASKIFANPVFPVNSYLLAGMLLQESRIGQAVGEQIPLGCEGTGDRSRGQSKSIQGAGHGLSQADASSGDAYLNGRQLGEYEDQWTKEVQLKPKFISDAVKKAFDTTKIGPYKWYDCRESILYGAAHHIYLAELVQCKSQGCGFIDDKFQRWGLSTSKTPEGKYSDPKTYKAFVQLAIDANNAGQGLKNKLGECRADAQGNVYDTCSADGAYGKQVFEYAIQAAKCMGVTTTIEEMINSSGTGGGNSAVCDPNAANINADGAEFPLLTKKGSINKVYYSQPYPEYIGGGGHNGIDMSPTSNGIGETSVVSTVDGQVSAVFLVLSTSCNVTCAQKNQLLVRIKEKDTGFEYTSIHLNPDLERPKLGQEVKKGTKIGQIDAFMFNHLHFETRLNGVLQNPIEHIKGWNKAIQASNVRAESSIIDAALYQKL